MAAGSGERFGGESKQFVALHGKPMVVWAIECFAKSRGIDNVTVVTTPGEEDGIRRAVDDHGLDKVGRIVPGGDTRQQSVWRGLQSLDSNSDVVLVHDAARPCLSGDLVQRVIDALGSDAAVVPVLPAVDTLIRESSGRLEKVVDREGISGVQTPQGFRTDLLIRAHQNAKDKGIVSSDDGSLIFALGETVRTIAGERTNIKITFEDDVPIAEAILSQRLV
jgi:2-C-methyl-D-erythritol 4-phosphate cytidylyltransferase